MICESACGLTQPAVFNPLSASSAIISILDPRMCFMDKADFQNDEAKSSEGLNFPEFKNNLTSKVCNTQISENNGKYLLCTILN